MTGEILRRRKFEEGGREKSRKRTEEEEKYKGIKFFNNFYDKDKRKPWFDGLNLERRLVSTVNLLRSNHYNLNESLWRKNYIRNSRCECGAEVQDITHVAVRCSQFDEARDKMYRELT